jgi:Restriction endonuclease
MGFFTFRGFDYLLEARWRKTQPPIGDLRAFSGKVKAKIESTRGLFLSIPGFRKEVVDEAATLSNLILMDGEELAVILEGRVSLVEGLQIKLDKAAQEGLLFFSLVRGG